MTPLLIIKTKNGFAAIEFAGAVPQASLDAIMVAHDMGYNSYSSGTLLQIVKDHFTEETKTAPVIATPPQRPTEEYAAPLPIVDQGF